MSMAATSISGQEITRALRVAGVEAGDIIMVHSSLSSFGHVEGGAEAVVDALIDAVGSGGIVMVPTLTATYADGISTGLAWNKQETPSRVGAVTEALRLRPDAHRSDHPTHSVAAVGRGAADLLKGHWPGTTFNIEGPFGKYVKAGGKIVFLGVFPKCNTTLHAVEDWLGLPYMPDVQVLVEKPGGGTEKVTASRSPTGHRDFYDKGGRIHRILDEAGVVNSVHVNDVCIRVMPAKKVVGVTIAAELETPGVLLCEKSDCEFCRNGRTAIMEVRDVIRETAKRLAGQGYAEMP